MKIAILSGGETRERDISIASAKNIQGIIHFAETKLFILPEKLDVFIEERKRFDVVIPMIHGKGGEDGSIQGLLETLKIPYIFSGIGAHSIALDKKRSKQIAVMLGYNVPQEKIEYPAFAKPRFGGSSVASGFCSSQSEYDALAQNSVEEYLLEEPITGREFTVGIIQHEHELITLPVIEIITPKDSFFGFEEKYNPDKLAREICPAEIPEELTGRLHKIALNIHREFDIRHISRTDFIVDSDGKIFFLEVNTIPGMTTMSLIPKMLKRANIDLGELIKKWCVDVTTN